MGRLKTVLLIMRRASLAQGLMAKVRDAPGIQLCYEPDYANADVAIWPPGHCWRSPRTAITASTSVWPCAHGCGKSRPTAGSC